MDTSNKLSAELASKINIIMELGCFLDSDSVLLDFGCGKGKMVKELSDHGYQVFGCDTKFDFVAGDDTDLLLQQEIIRKIDLINYSLPFKDNTFDFIFSQSVFEHVKNYPETISEIARVLKPNGCCLHLFPSRNRFIEPHVFVPFATVLISRPWLYIWTYLGIRNQFTTSLKAKETSELFYNYLLNETNYLSKKQLIAYFGKQFEDVKFCEDLSIKYSPHKGKIIHSILKYFPFIFSVYSTFRTRIIFMRKPCKL
jgi:SAM-dependent methyltransferase